MISLLHHFTLFGKNDISEKKKSHNVSGKRSGISYLTTPTSQHGALRKRRAMASLRNEYLRYESHTFIPEPSFSKKNAFRFPEIFKSKSIADNGSPTENIFKPLANSNRIKFRLSKLVSWTNRNQNMFDIMEQSSKSSLQGRIFDGSNEDFSKIQPSISKCKPEPKFWWNYNNDRIEVVSCSFGCSFGCSSYRHKELDSPGTQSESVQDTTTLSSLTIPQLQSNSTSLLEFFVPSTMKIIHPAFRRDPFSVYNGSSINLNITTSTTDHSVTENRIIPRSIYDTLPKIPLKSAKRFQNVSKSNQNRVTFDLSNISSYRQETCKSDTNSYNLVEYDHKRSKSYDNLLVDGRFSYEHRRSLSSNGLDSEISQNKISLLGTRWEITVIPGCQCEVCRKNASHNVMDDEVWI